jgi:hypothetical protein
MRTMRTGRPTPPVVLSAEERQTLEQWARRPTTAHGLAQRARSFWRVRRARRTGRSRRRPVSRGKR